MFDSTVCSSTHIDQSCEPSDATIKHPSGLITAQICLCFSYLAFGPQKNTAGLSKEDYWGWSARWFTCFRVVSRLQGDSLSESRSEEERRPHVAEQAVPVNSCMLHHAAPALRSDARVIPRSDAPSFLLCSSVAWGGLVARTVAGMRGHISGVVLCKYPPDIHQQTIKIILQTSITASHFAAQLLSGVEKKKQNKKAPQAFLK